MCYVCYPICKSLKDFNNKKRKNKSKYSFFLGLYQASDSPLDLSAEELDIRMKLRIKEENRYLDGKTFLSASTLSKAVRNS